MFCRNCGMRLPDSTKFCDKCGANTQYYSDQTQEPAAPPASVTPTPVPPPAPAAPAKPKSTASDETYAEVFADIRRREFKKTVIIPIVTIIVITALILLITPSITGARQSKAAVREVMEALCDYNMPSICRSCYDAPNGDTYELSAVEYKIEYKIKSVEKLDEDDLAILQERHERAYISAGTKVKVTITEHTDQGKNIETVNLIVLKVNTSWEVYYPSLNYELTQCSLLTWDLLN